MKEYQESIEPHRTDTIENKDVLRETCEQIPKRKKVAKFVQTPESSIDMGKRENASQGSLQPGRIDPKEVHRLYFDEKLSMMDIASRYGYKTTGPISRVFKEQGWKSRPAVTLEIKAKPEEVHRLYFDERLSLKEVAVKMGYRSQTPIRRIFKEQGWETRKRWKKLDYGKIFELYFERRMSLENVARKMELSSHYPVVCIFDEQGWKRRTPHGRRFEMNLDDVFEKYFVRRMTMKEIGESYGYKSGAPIAALFREQGWNSRRTETVDMDINPDQVQELYFEQGLPLEEVGRRIGKTRYALLKLFEKMEWKLRGSKCESEEERELRRTEAQRRHQEKVNELRDEIFGIECEICSEEREIIHRKDGKEHSPYLTLSLKGLQNVDPEEWAPVCKSCHLDVHALMRVKTFEWEKIKEFLREAS